MQTPLLGDTLEERNEDGQAPLRRARLGADENAKASEGQGGGTEYEPSSHKWDVAREWGVDPDELMWDEELKRFLTPEEIEKRIWGDKEENQRLFPIDFPYLTPEMPREKEKTSKGDYEAFLQDFSSGESGRDYEAELINNPSDPYSWYFGKYQIGMEVMQTHGYIDANGNWTQKAREDGIESWEDFKKAPEFQEKVKRQVDERFWQDCVALGLTKYIGTKVGQDQILVTASGLLAAANSKGPTGLKNIFEHNLWGTDREKDGNGKPVSDYLRDFGGYDISIITGGGY